MSKVAAKNALNLVPLASGFPSGSPSPVDNARAVLERLQNDLSAIHLARAGVDAESKELAFAAHGQCDDDAKERIAAIRVKRTGYELEAQDLASAIEVAKDRLAAVERHAANAQERANGERALEVLPEYLKLLADLDEHLAGAAQAITEIKETFDVLNRLGCAPATWDLTAIHLQAVAMARLQGGILRYERFLAPSERRFISDLATAWEHSCRTRANTKINGGE